LQIRKITAQCNQFRNIYYISTFMGRDGIVARAVFLISDLSVAEGALYEAL